MGWLSRFAFISDPDWPEARQESKLNSPAMEAQTANVFPLFLHVRSRVVPDSWVLSQIWLDSDSNESSQSRVGRENQGYESSQSRITLIVIWVRVESTGYCLSQSWVTDFSKRKRQDLAIICNFTEMNQPTATFDRTPPPPAGQQLFPN